MILNNNLIQSPIFIAFDHLHSEYLTVRAGITDTKVTDLIDGLAEKKKDSSLCWNDLYYLELVLAENQPVEKLRSKVIRLRFDYRSIAGQKEFDDYLASKPPDLQSPPDPTDPPHPTQAQYENLLREDLKDLLGRIYLKYAILPTREEQLNKLTWFAACLCAIFLGLLLTVLGIMFFAPLFQNNSWRDGLSAIYEDGFSPMTIFVVVIGGALGGFVSALRRIQSPPTEGDSLYNLSLLFQGSKSVFVAPISGAIFATLLYLMFAAGILTGTFFPTIYSPSGKYVAVTSSESQKNPGTGKSPTTQTTTTEPTSPGTSSPVPTVTPSPMPTPGLVPIQ